MNILSLFVRHGEEKYPDAHEALQNYYRSNLPEADIRYVIIDNALADGARHETRGSALLLGGSNDFWEFSAWESALRILRPSQFQYDYIHFVTSAFHQLYTGYIDRVDARMLSDLLGRDVVLGHVDAYGEPVRFLGCTSQAWLRSSFFFASPNTLRRLGSLVSLRNPGRWFSGDPDGPFRPDAPLSPAMVDHVVNWLTGQGTGQGTVWHSRFDLSAETLEYFENKALAILNEHALSLRLIAQGSALVDATWMSAVLHGAEGTNYTSLSDWRSQLNERRPYL